MRTKNSAPLPDVIVDGGNGSLPRPEYPRPQFVRQEWLSLNGEWEFAIDADDEGLGQCWQDGGPLPDRIQVPFAYQTKLSGIDDQAIYPVVWYARGFEVPPEWRGSDLLLQFGAVDYRTTVWVNGLEVGHNQGGHVPFTFNIAPYLREGENRLTVRVEDAQDAEQPRGKQAVSGKPRGCDYFCTTGIWQSVWLEPVPHFRIDELRITPQLSEGDADVLELRVFLHAPAIGWELELEVLDDETVVAQTTQATSGASAVLRVRIPGAKRWSPETPHLYSLKIRLRREGQVVDEVGSYAGLRHVELREGQFFLNGEATYLAMVLDQGYWPESGMTAPSDAALRADVEWCRRFGFNCARKHQKLEDPRWLYWCDRLGLMVWGEMPNARAWSPRAEECFVAEWERAVRRDVGHPCVITWVPVNESWGVPGLRDDHPGQYAFLERLVALTRRLDPDRPVIDNDGWEHSDVSDILAIHDYTPSGAELRARYAEAMAGGPLPARTWGEGKIKTFARGAMHRGQPIMLTEVGGFLMQPDLPKEKWDWLYGIYGSCRTAEELIEKYRDLMEGIAALTFVSGFCYTQLTDIEQESNGLLTYDRRPKVEPEQIREIHRRLFLAKEETAG